MFYSMYSLFCCSQLWVFMMRFLLVLFIFFHFGESKPTFNDLHKDEIHCKWFMMTATITYNVLTCIGKKLFLKCQTFNNKCFTYVFLCWLFKLFSYTKKKYTYINLEIKIEHSFWYFTNWLIKEGIYKKGVTLN